MYCNVHFSYIHCTLRVLQIMNSSHTYILQTDVSDLELGTILSQTVDGEEHPTVYASQKLLPREIRYSVTEKECLAIVWALKIFHVYF